MKRVLKSALIALPLLALAIPALAAAAEESAEAPSLFAGDLGNSAWTLVIFVIVLIVLGKFAWGPILNSLQSRENFIREALESAKHDREAAEARLKEYEQKLAASRAEATAIVEEGRRDAEVVKRRIEAAAKEEADKTIERAKREIQIATDTATKELYTLSAKLATQLAAQVIGRELSPQDHQRLISQAIDGIAGAGRN
ncbi:MAG TPA: F0F1 ATP synthase subunit B [Thermoanaerobaculia bacterium]|jgi:F-type H+-transporting ATPase subunit b|nr:F0F1 ATP synthase subunit B [Thermoanaerobaculia bacterium]